MNARLPILVLMVIAIPCSTELIAQSKHFRKNGRSPNFSIEKIAEGVWAAIANDHYGKAICNAGIIDLGNKTIVYDPFMTPEAATELRIVAEGLTKKPVSLVINSHYHNDHIRGNQAFGPAAIISSSFTRDEIARVEPGEQQWEQKHAATLLKATRQRMSSATSIEKEELPLWIGYYEGMVESASDLKMTLPDIVFNDSLWILGWSRNIKLVERKSGHTPSDLVLLIPDAGIAFMGDLLFVDRHPWISDGDPESWKASLKLFYEDPLYETFVPGHGKVAGRESLKQLYDYFSAVQDLCNTAKTDSLQILLLQQPIPQPYQNWYFGKFYQANLQYILGARKEEED